MKKIIPFLFVLPAYAGTLEVVSKPYVYQERPEFKAIMAHLKTFGEFEQKLPEPPKTMSKGERAVEEAKARNRAILAQMNSKKEEAPLTELEKWKKEERDTLNQWKKEERETLNQWKREQEIFLGRIKVYKENTFVLPVKVEKIIEKQVPVEAIPDVHVVNETFSVPVRDQSDRPTCVAFAGIRAMEIILSQNSTSADLSEQYLYWAGKPNCQKAPCAEKGSWIREAFSFSQRQPTIDIPSEKNCAYQTTAVDSNETQIPLQPGCHQGEAKVVSFQEARTLSDVIDFIKKDTPVVVAAKLSENFYKNPGLVTLKDAEKSLREHSKGHAFLAVGVVELPAKLRSEEGNYCLLVTNSWGVGWGAGGYSCLTEKWLEKFRQPSPFVALTKISVK